jgi:ATP-dependent Clp protease ATP-binding subunit ClpB
MEGIIRIQIDNLGKQLARQDISIELTDGCIAYLINQGFDMQFGARPLKRMLQKKILDGLSMALLEGSVSSGMHVKIDEEQGSIVFHPEKRTEAELA